jgi:hypothetical protein
MLTFLSETCHLSQSKGILHLKGNSNQSVLYVKKQARAITFYVYGNTIWQYYAGREIHEELLPNFYQYEEIVNQGKIDLQQPLAMQFEPVLALLTNGYYELQYKEWHTIKIFSTFSRKATTCDTDFYPFGNEILATQTHLDKFTVENYKTQIRSGKRPITVLLHHKEADHYFIIDGHHKLHAYKELEIKPFILLISKLDCKDISKQESIDILLDMSIGQSDGEILQFIKKIKIID